MKPFSENQNNDKDNDGFVSVVLSDSRRKGRRLKYDTRSVCPSEECKSFSDRILVMTFVEKVSEHLIRVKCKWCANEYEIPLRILRSERKTSQEPSHPPRPVIANKKLQDDNLFSILEEDPDSGPDPGPR